MSSRPLDTSLAAWAEYLRVLDRMSGEERVKIALDLSDAVRRIRIAGLRAQFPDESEEQIVRRFIE
jgi:hypothetical protein